MKTPTPNKVGMIWARNMDQSPKLQANCQQKLMLTQRMQQSLKILQLSQLELGALIAEEIEKNPLLEIAAESFSTGGTNNHAEYTFPDCIASISLDEHLISQIGQVFDDPQDRFAAEELAGSLDEKGFLTEALTPQQQTLLPVLQTLDPPGIFARSCQEGLLLQLKRLNLKDSTAYSLVLNHYEDLLQKRFGKITKQMPCSSQQLTEAIAALAKLSLRPATSYHSVPCQPIYPDLQVVKINDKWKLSPIEDALPKFHLKTDYQNVSGISKEQKELLKGFSTSAKWLQQGIIRRRELLFQVASQLIQYQKNFLDNEGPLVTISPADLATQFGVHESTISRALADKYLESPLGTIPLSSLISTHGTDPAKQLVRRIILQENKQRPLTDDELAQRLKEAGLTVARRTVAKYRMECKIGAAKTRKQIQ